MIATSFDPDESVTLAYMDGIATSVAKSVRESIAANVEALGCCCDCWSLEAMRGQESLEIGGSRHWRSCPIAVAFAIRRGKS